MIVYLAGREDAPATRHQEDDMTTHGFKIERVRINDGASRETICYSAAITFDGKTVGRASNDGWGGPDLVAFESRDYDDIFESAASDAYPHLNVIEASDRLLCDLFVEAMEGTIA